ncbi:MAG: alkaline phosphatase family protein [Frankiaceae bacterium]|nr:alkaline phosphatase family protein [Frankiaceae bacterium]
MAPMTRRQLLASSAAVAGAVATGTSATSASAAPFRARRNPHTKHLPNPAHSGIDHIVVVLMENRSFDHYLGWLPGAVGKQHQQFLDDAGTLHKTYRLQTRQGCGSNDPDHSYDGGRLQFNNGKCDGFRKGTNDDFAIGYYKAADLPLYAKLVEQSTVMDHWFASIMSSTYPNRYYTHAARTERIDNAFVFSGMPTIWDRLKDKGISHTYFYSDLPFLGLWGEKYMASSRPVADFFVQAASGTLPHYSYLDPLFIGEGQGGTNDDHPHADILRGQAFLSEVIQAVTHSPQWRKTALIITYDEWGGFFDHVSPPRFPDDYQTYPGEVDHAQAGFRVPAFVISPFARRGVVDHGVHEHTSILKFVEWRFGLHHLSARDRHARNLAHSLNFAKPDFSVPNLPVVVDPGPHLCNAPAVGMANHDDFWAPLADYVKHSAWRHNA